MRRSTSILWLSTRDTLARLALVTLTGLMLMSCAGPGVEPITTTKLKKHPDGQVYLSLDQSVEIDFMNSVALMESGEYAEAVPLLEQVIANEQRLIAPYVNLAIAYARTGDSKNAELTLNKALEFDSAHPVANNELGILYRKAGKFDQAREVFENIIVLHPEYTPAKRNLGVLCDLYLHDFECALKHYLDYFAMRPEEKEMEIWIVDVEQRLAGGN